MRNNGGPTRSIIQTVLEYDNVTDEHISLCEEITSNPIVLSLPVPNTEHVLPFAAVAGPENSKDPAKRTPGCYLIKPKGDDNMSNSYVGQSVHTGNRVKDHANGKDPRTAKFVESMQGNGEVLLFLLSPEVLSKLPEGLTLTQFLCVLEQYLFFKYRPCINAAFVAKPGIPWTEQATAQHRAATGEPVYIYRSIESDQASELELVYTADSMGHVSELFGYERTWLKNVMKRGGWYRQSVFFSKVPLDETLDCHMSQEDLCKYVAELKSLPQRTGGNMAVCVLDITTQVTVTYRSKNEAARAMDCDVGVFKNNRKNLFRGKYLITVKLPNV